jgi:hypothetical protein
MVATPRRTAAALAVATALAMLPCASHAVVINPCLFSTLTVDSTLGNSPFALTSGSISYACEVVGDGDFGVFNQSGGTNTITYGGLILGRLASGAGFYNLGGGTLNAGTISSGAGFGVLTISGGTVNYTSMQLGGLYIGEGTPGSLLVGAGQSVTANAIYVGDLGGTGTFTIDGGANVSTSALRIAQESGNFGTVNLNGGTLTTSYTTLGKSGGGTFNQAGGTHTVSFDLQLGDSGGGGRYRLQGGTLNVGNVTSGSGFNILEVNGGTLNFASSISVTELWVGNSAAGSLAVGSGKSVSANQILVGVNGGNGTLVMDAGASVSATGVLEIGITVGSQGTVTMNGGTLTTGSATIAISGTGTFNQAGGTHTVSGSLGLGTLGAGNGTYNLSGGTLTDASASIGSASLGTFNQTGGAHTTVGALRFGTQAGGSGTYTLRGGTYTVGGDITTGPGKGTLNIDGGTLYLGAGHSISVTNLALGSTPGTSGAYTQSSGNVSVAADMLLGGPGASGTYTLQGGSLSVGGVITTGSPTSVLNLDGGSVSVGGGSISVGTLNLGSDAAHSFSYALPSGGSVTARYLNVGLSGGGDFQQSGGSVTASGNLTIAANPGSSGSYALSGGTLSTGTLTNNGLFSYTGGTLALTGAFTNSGIYEQAGGTLTLPGGSAHVNSGSMSFTSTSQFRALDDFANHGTLTLNGAQVSGTGLLHNDADGVIQGPGLIGTPFANAGAVLVNAGTTRIQQAFANSGSIQLGGTGSTLLGGAIGNTGSIQGAGTVGNNIQNSGTVEAIGGTLVLGGAVTNGAAGLLTAGSGSKLVVNAGLATNQGTINLTGGTFDNNNHALANAGQISGYGIVRTGGLSNQGTITLATGVSTVNGGVTNQSAGHIEIAHGAAVFTGAVDNQGTFKTTGATVTFAGGFTNAGAYVSDPSTQSFMDLVVSPTGYLVGGAGDVFKVSHSFINQSAQNTAWNTRGASLVFNGAGSENVLLAGLDKGALYDGYADNFAWGSVELAAGAGLSITAAPGSKGALYAGLLMLDGGLGQLASIMSDSNIYYDPLLSGNSYLGGQTYALAGAGFLIPTAVPEPGTYAMLLAGIGLLGFAARRRVRL